MQSIQLLNSNGGLTEEHLNVLADKKRTSEVLKNSFPILLKLPEEYTDTEKSKLSKDENGRNRYYLEEINLYGCNYLVTNNWYYKGLNGRDTRTPFINWNCIPFFSS